MFRLYAKGIYTARGDVDKLMDMRLYILAQRTVRYCRPNRVCAIAMLQWWRTHCDLWLVAGVYRVCDLLIALGCQKNGIVGIH